MRCAYSFLIGTFLILTILPTTALVNAIPNATATSQKFDLTPRDPKIIRGTASFTVRAVTDKDGKTNLYSYEIVITFDKLPAFDIGVNLEIKGSVTTIDATGATVATVPIADAMGKPIIFKIAALRKAALIQFPLKADGTPMSMKDTGSRIKNISFTIEGPNSKTAIVKIATGTFAGPLGPPGPNNGAGCGALPQPKNCYPIQ